MYILLITFIVLAALLMVGIVLIQESRGGGMASRYDNYKKLVGVTKSTTIVERTTWVLAAVIVVISVACSYLIT